MGIGKLSEKASELSDVIPYYFFCLFFSCISFSVAIIVFSGETSWLRPLPVIIYSFYVVIPYLLFAVPLQVFFNKYPRKFNLFYLFVYIIFSFIAVFIFYIVENLDFAMNVVKMKEYYELSLSASVVFWIWDSIFLQKKTDSS
ncbi:UPF0715 family protein [Peribacillus butanolivorans]|uniref:Uncharacterized protein n=1 Tax=Peribacillus butanolivorans TaxID=421767 RepID=A0AAX0RZX7_9BACI|nr:UPF0715 family protein [Peribacillus butanolivorans]PEJ29880.1 hypothetical protein CN689_21610 [Peribacillus butanolivorans]